MTSLASIPALGGVTPAVLERLAEDSREARYAAGTVLRAAGVPAPAVILLLAGTVVAVYRAASGAQVWPARWEGPAIVDKPSVLHGGVPMTELLATTACVARLLPRARFLRLLDEEESVRAHVLGHLAGDVLAGRDRLGRAATEPAVAQVAAVLAAGGAPAPSVGWRGSQEELARLLGLSRVTVNRALRKLTEAGAVRVTPAGVLIVDRQRLRSFLSPPPATPAASPPAGRVSAPGGPPCAGSA